jgi:hypothetical protein
MNSITTRKNHYPTLQVSQIFYQRNKESLHKYSDLIIEMARKLYKNPSYNALKLVLRRKKLSTVGRKNHFQIKLDRSPDNLEDNSIKSLLNIIVHSTCGAKERL